MLGRLLLALIVALAALMEIQVAAQRREPRCPNPPVDGWPEPTGCDYGIARDICGKPSCAVGPGGMCKYKRFRASNCGEGTFCHCSRCMGCSLHSYICFETTCVFAMASR
ncbi:Neuroparsin-A [Orchesella cincta]|uniref:Neuroparsin-A n=1 Tax=Orchesella cincta TaxID=48709 RepID=A0A1D2MS94_ORCCI|nr:Neuroparsin-A [Orchesella cincta]